MSVRVVLADDEQLVRAGFRLILESEPDFAVIGEAGNGAEAVRLAKELDPDIVLMDVQMPEMDGLEATRRIVALGREDTCRVVVLTTFDVDEYVYEALRAGGFAHEAKVNIRWVASDECETEAGAAKHLADVDAVLVPGGFGVRGIEGKLGALRYTRTHGIPTLGLCLGLQCMVIEYARNVAGLEKAGSTEFDPDTVEPVISTIEEQKKYVEGAGDLGGTMRLGLQKAELAPGSVVRAAYGTDVIERWNVRSAPASSAFPSCAARRKSPLAASANAGANDMLCASAE